MSKEEFYDKCAGCRPILIDVETGKPMPPDSRPMRAIRKVWKTTTRREREAFHKFTCLNMWTPEVLTIVDDLKRRIEKAVGS